ncbi:hypothetical protein HOLleu_05619 [Holothuria leucospilota]|uniref:Uncharacterized protein n=1 Tax=Holothuria leucospilota TaxID=206669 RepID=A0A9Q1CKC5_HOLLE|nr:hypothetical protein HOLleu_05619 [Holothuria leucospilota]
MPVIRLFVCLLALSCTVATKELFDNSKDTPKSLKQYIITKLTQEKTKQLENYLKKYSETLALLKKEGIFRKRDWLNDHYIPKGFGDVGDVGESDDASKEVTEFDPFGRGFWMDKPFLDLVDLSVETRDDLEDYNDGFGGWLPHPAQQPLDSQDQPQIQEGGFDHSGWGKFITKRTSGKREEA